MLVKSICVKCHIKYEFGWNESDNLIWDNKKVVCPIHLFWENMGDMGDMNRILNPPPHYCPYYMEHVILSN